MEWIEVSRPSDIETLLNAQQQLPADDMVDYALAAGYRFMTPTTACDVALLSAAIYNVVHQASEAILLVNLFGVWDSCLVVGLPELLRASQGYPPEQHSCNIECLTLSDRNYVVASLYVYIAGLYDFGLIVPDTKMAVWFSHEEWFAVNPGLLDTGLVTEFLSGWERLSW